MTSEGSIHLNWNSLSWKMWFCFCCFTSHPLHGANATMHSCNLDFFFFTIPWLSSPLIIDRTAPPAAGRSPAWSARAGCQVRATAAESQRRGKTDGEIGQTAFQSTFITLVLIHQLNRTKYKSNKSLQKELNMFLSLQTEQSYILLNSCHLVCWLLSHIID